MKLTDEFEAISGIYIFTNLINGKVYIGETKNIKERLREHRSSKKQVISRAIQKYGIGNFDVYVEYFPDFTRENRLDLEEQLIIKFDCLVPKGYNVTPRGMDVSGGTGYKHTEKAKQEISVRNKGNKSRTGQKNSEETKKKISQSAMRNQRWLGRKHSAETRRKMSEVRILKYGKKSKTNSTDSPL